MSGHIQNHSPGSNEPYRDEDHISPERVDRFMTRAGDLILVSRGQGGDGDGTLLKGNEIESPRLQDIIP